MNKILLLLLATLFFVSCNNIEKHQKEIVTVSGERDIVTESFRELNRNISGELERWSFYQSEIAKSQENLPEMSGEQQKKLNDLLGKFSGYSSKFSAFIQEVNGFAQDFPAQEVQLDSMKKALVNSSKFDGNIKRILNDVQQINEASKGKIKAWEEQLNKMSQEIEADYQQIRELQGAPVQ